ncbi:MAG: hypothetical protein FJ087_09640 [Deltaproteobacteria bacterium]|nr:hypothetical protein [Deltaproteobacteria bacterium]
MTTPKPHPDLAGDPALRERLAASVAKKAWDLYELLSQAMAKQDVDLSTIDLPGEVAGRRETRVERLRRYFDAVSAAQRRSRTDAFGLCTACGAPIPVPVLTETPWRARCSGCPERG